MEQVRTNWRDRRYPLSVPLALDVLKRDFNASKNHQKKIDKLCETYDSFRRVRGDGNCFYRALGFALLELRETAAYNFDIPADVLAEDDLAVQYGRLQCLRGSELYWQLMTDADLDLAIVKMLRRLVRKYMLEHADESVTPSEDGVLTISEYVSTYPIPATSSPSPSRRRVVPRRLTHTAGGMWRQEQQLGRHAAAGTAGTGC